MASSHRGSTEVATAVAGLLFSVVIGVAALSDGVTLRAAAGLLLAAAVLLLGVMGLRDGVTLLGVALLLLGVAVLLLGVAALRDGDTLSVAQLLLGVATLLLGVVMLLLGRRDAARSTQG